MNTEVTLGIHLQRGVTEDPDLQNHSFLTGAITGVPSNEQRQQLQHHTAVESCLLLSSSPQATSTLRGPRWTGNEHLRPWAMGAL